MWTRMESFLWSISAPLTWDKKIHLFTAPQEMSYSTIFICNSDPKICSVVLFMLVRNVMLHAAVICSFLHISYLITLMLIGIWILPKFRLLQMVLLSF